MLQVRPIRDEDDYRAALSAVSPFFDAEPDPDSDEGAAFDAMVTLIEAYERRHFPTDPADPIDAIRFRMEQQGLTPKDLQPMIGALNRVYEVLARSRPLTMPMIRRLHAGLGIPAEILIAPARPPLTASL